MPELWLQLGEGTAEPGKTVRLPGTRFELGRGRSVDLQVGGKDVSRRHLAVELRAGAWVLQDLGSQHGSLVNGRPVQTAELRVGDVVQLGKPGPVVRVQRLDPDPAAKPPPPPPAVRRPAAPPPLPEQWRPQPPPRRDRIGGRRRTRRWRRRRGRGALIAKPAAPAVAAPAPRPVKRGGFWFPFLFGLLIGAGGLYAVQVDPIVAQLLGHGPGGAAGALRVTEPGPVHEIVVPRTASYQLLRLRLEEHSVEGRTKGQPVRVLSTGAFLPVVVSRDRTLADALAETRAWLAENVGESGSDSWRARLASGRTRAPSSWSVDVDRQWRPRPLGLGEVPLPLTRTKSEQGPAW